MAWYLRQCDGEWEHGFGIRLETLDNPGWSLRISTLRTDTELSDRAAVEVNLEDEINWMVYRVEEGDYVAHGGPNMLAKMIQTFFRISAQ